MKDFRSLVFWQKAHQFVLDLYRATKTFPEDERFELISQIRRAAVSIPSNIAEGCGRHGDAELKRFLQIAMGSASEVEYQLQLSKDLGYLGSMEFSKMNTELIQTKKMLNAFIQKLTVTTKSQPPIAKR